ncbi:MAG: guanylate cyclase [Bacteroidetes bacterium]|nr:guanylate cyclase [Bacteroidota bacterium]
MNEKIRFLAAIMFTDIVGYTALMQHDETLAKDIRDKHRKVLEETILKYKGNIIQYYGDGTLSMFGSAVEAVNCAVEIQKEFQLKPVIPLRIGIHVGDIVYEDDGAYGDGVNVASRIQSMAVAGSILVSDKVNDELVNHPEIKTLSFGRFELKNVKRPVEIIAISNTGLKIPSSEELSVKAGRVLKSIAVLPFVNMSNDPENEYFSDGITEEILNALTKVEGLQVTSRTSSFAFKGKNEDIRSIGKQLNVTTVLEGSVRKAGSKVRITSQLINTMDGFHIWSETYDRNLEDIFQVQDEISNKIASTLKQKLTGKNSNEPLVKSPTSNIEAYNLFLKGLFHWYKWTPASIKKAMDYYKKAIQLEPEFAMAYSRLCGCYIFLGATGYMNTEIAYPVAKEYAEKALAIDDNIPETYSALGFVKLFFDWNFPEAEKLFIKSINLNSGQAELYNNYALFLRIQGRMYESLEQIEIAHNLDPLSINILSSLGEVLLNVKEFQKSLEIFERVLEMNPDYRPAIYGLGWANWHLGNKEKAVEIFEKIPVLIGDNTKGITPLGYIYGRMGRIKDAEECISLLEKREKNDSEVSLEIDFAVIYAGLGKMEKVFEYLNKAYNKKFGSLLFIKSFQWNYIQEDPRYKELLGKIGLPV